jgi:predicted dehydrogenase
MPDARKLTRRAWIAATAASAAAQTAPAHARLPRKVRVAIVGTVGHPTEITRPLAVLPDVEVVAVSDADRGALARFARGPLLKNARQYTDYRAMLDREQLDMVAVCNSNGERAGAVLEAASRKLHVIAEKPLATQRADFDRIKQVVARNGVKLGMLLPMRYSPSYLALKKIVAEGLIGEVAQIGAQKSYKTGDRPEWMRRRSTYGSTMLWIGPHMIDLMLWASGRDFTEAVSFASHIGFPEIGDMENATGTLFRMDNGGVAALRMDYFRTETAATHGDDRLRLAGTKGIAEYQASTGVTLMTPDRKPEVIGDLPDGGSVFVDFVQHVYNGKPATLTLSEIYRVNEVVLGAHESAERHQIVKL